MVSNIPEIDDAIALINRAYWEVSDEGFLIAEPKVGVMMKFLRSLILDSVH